MLNECPYALGSFRPYASAAPQLRDKLAVVDGQYSESRFGQVDVRSGKERLDFAQKGRICHGVSINGFCPIRQWGGTPSPKGGAPLYRFAMRIRKDWRARLEKLVENAGGNRAALSQRAKLNPTYLRDVLAKGQTPKADSAQKLSDALGVALTEWFLDPGSSPPLPKVAWDDQREVPVFDVRASAGAGALATDGEPIHYLVFREPWLRRISRQPDQLVVLEISGDSMWETLHDGDHALVDRSQTNPRREGLYVLRIDDILQVKRLSMHPVTKLLTIKSDNPAYPTYGEVNPDDVAVVGRVVWIGRSLG